MPLSTDQISQIHAALLSTINLAIDEALENELYSLDSDIDAWDVAYEAKIQFPSRYRGACR